MVKSCRQPVTVQLFKNNQSSEFVVVCVGRRKYRRDDCDGDAVMTDSAAAAPVPLSTCSAVVSSFVIWVAFSASHLTFVLQSDVAGLAAFEEPLICVYGTGELGAATDSAATDRG